jgi:hypothetical protein
VTTAAEPSAIEVLSSWALRSAQGPDELSDESPAHTTAAASCAAETRIGLFGLLGETRTEPLAFVSTRTHRACGDPWPELTKDLGFFGQEDPARSDPRLSPYQALRGQWTGRTDPLGEFDVPVHEDIIEAALSRAGADREAIDRLKGWQAAIDRSTQQYSYQHFDDNDFAGGIQKTEEWRVESARNPDIYESLHVLARRMHALHDFYSHSNYLENFIAASPQYSPILDGLPHDIYPAEQLAAGIPLWDRASTAKVFGLPLRSGFFPRGPRGELTHEDLNKDNPNSKEGGAVAFQIVNPYNGTRPLVKLLYVAKGLAIRETARVWSEFYSARPRLTQELRAARVKRLLTDRDGD